jgi:type VI secretion system FHA domain protein
VPVNEGDELPAPDFGDIQSQPLDDDLFDPAPGSSGAPLAGISVPDAALPDSRSTPERIKRSPAESEAPAPEQIPEDFLAADAVPHPSPVSTAPRGTDVIPDDWYLAPQEGAIPEEPASPPSGSEPAPPAAPSNTPPPAPAMVPPPGAQPEPPVTAAGPDPRQAQTALEDSDLSAGLRRALYGALGAQGENLSPQELLRVVEELAAIVALSTPQLMRALAARTEVKDLLRLNQTMVRARDNNPLKFCETPVEAVEHMLLNDHPGLLNGRLAMEEAFREIADHQRALFAALQPALQETIARLSPAAVQSAAESDSPGGFSLHKGKGRLWETYVSLFEKMNGPGRGNLEKKFMHSLAEHYERNTIKTQN